jgi:hypothetical protein
MSNFYLHEPDSWRIFPVVDSKTLYRVSEPQQREKPTMNGTQRALDLTDAQWRILEHRLAVPEAIADGLTDNDPDTAGMHRTWRPDNVKDCARDLWAGRWKEAHDLSGEGLVAEVLRDAVEGCTYIQAMTATESPQQIASAERAYHNLCDKIEARFGGREIKRRY